jgi:hypothetical protein
MPAVAAAGLRAPARRRLVALHMLLPTTVCVSAVSAAAATADQLDADPEALSMGWRVLHALGATVYLASARELYAQRTALRPARGSDSNDRSKVAAAERDGCCSCTCCTACMAALAHSRLPCCLYLSAFVLSVLWSLTRHGGPGSALQWADHAAAYLIVAYNYGVLFQVPWRSWSSQWRTAFAVCHAAAALFLAEDVLREWYGWPAWITYGILHFIWRVMGGVGAYLIVSAPCHLLHRDE